MNKDEFDKLGTLKSFIWDEYSRDRIGKNTSQEIVRIIDSLLESRHSSQGVEGEEIECYRIEGRIEALEALQTLYRNEGIDYTEFIRQNKNVLAEKRKSLPPSTDQSEKEKYL